MSTSMAILKSPALIDASVTLGRTSAGQQSFVAASIESRDVFEADLRSKITAQVRAELEAEYQSKLEALKGEAFDQAMSEGYKEGLASGHRDGQAGALDAFKKKQQILDKVLEQAQSELGTWLASVQDEATDLAKRALCVLLGEQALNPGVLLHAIERATIALRDADVLAIRLHPVECQLLRSTLKHAEAGTAMLEDKLREDASLGAGGVAIDTLRGEYRATLDVQLRKLMALVDEQRDAARSGAPLYHAPLRA